MYTSEDLSYIQKQIKPYYKLLQAFNKKDLNYNAITGMVTFEVLIQNMLSSDNWNDFNESHNLILEFRGIYTSPANDHKLMFFLENIDMIISGYLMSLDQESF